MSSSGRLICPTPPNYPHNPPYGPECTHPARRAGRHKHRDGPCVGRRHPPPGPVLGWRCHMPDGRRRRPTGPPCRHLPPAGQLREYLRRGRRGIGAGCVAVCRAGVCFCWVPSGRPAERCRRLADDAAPAVLRLMAKAVPGWLLRGFKNRTRLAALVPFGSIWFQPTATRRRPCLLLSPSAHPHNPR